MRRRVPLFVPAGLAVLAAWLLASGDPAQAAQDYDVTVLVMRTGAESGEVAVAYLHRVDHRALSAAIAGVARAAGVQVTGLALRDEPLPRGMTERGTSAEFQAA